MKNEYKHIFDNIHPEPQLMDSVINADAKGRRSAVSPRLVAGVAVMALIVTGTTISAGHANKPVITKPATASVTVQKAAPDFSIIAYAQDAQCAPKVLGDDDITLMNIRLHPIAGEEGNAVSTESDSCMSIKSDDDIDSVTFECEQGSFHYLDTPLRDKMIADNTYYAAIIPITPEQSEEYRTHIAAAEAAHKSTLEYKAEFIKSLLTDADNAQYIYDSDFDASRLSDDRYDIYTSDDDGYDVENELYGHSLLVCDREKTAAVLMTDTKHLVAKAYKPGDSISGVFYDPDAQTSYLLSHPDTPLDQLPQDNLTVTVKYKSGQSVTKHMLAKFNSNGVMTMEYTD